MVYLDALSLDCCTDPDSSSFPLSSLLGNRHQQSVVDCNCTRGWVPESKQTAFVMITDLL